MAKPEVKATIKIDCSELDRCTEKVNQLIALLETVQKLIDSLSGGDRHIISKIPEIKTKE